MFPKPTPDRRTFLAGLGGAVAIAGLSAGPALASSSTRRFVATLGRRQIGESSITLSRSGGSVTADIDVRLHIGLLGIVSFDYHLSSREVWRNGVLQELRSTTDNDGKQEYVNAHRVDGGLQINGSAFQGLVPGNPATTSYFTADFLGRPTWISTQNGRPLDLTIRNAGATQFNTSEGSLSCTKYTTRGRLNINLFYDQNVEWVGSSLRVVGRDANISMTSRGRSFNQIWVG